VRRATLLIAVTAGFGLLYLAATVALGSPPDAGASGEEVAAWFRGHGGHVRAWLWLLTVSAPLFAVFAVLVRAALPAPHRDVFLFGAIAFAAETAVQGWIWGGLAWHAEALEPATARTLLDVASFWGPVLTSTTVTMLAPVAVLALRDRAGLPRWVGVLCGLAVAEQLAETVTVFGRHGFLAPGGAMNVVVGAGVTAVALIGVGVALARRPAVGGALRTAAVDVAPTPR
jgi:apolipoprotein N-acyltransferase